MVKIKYKKYREDFQCAPGLKNKVTNYYIKVQLI